MLMIFAGLGFKGKPVTWIPAAHSMAETMSESRPPHLPSARSGRIWAFQVMPATPAPLFVAAPRIPAVRVPCQELGPAVALPHRLAFPEMSLLVTQSPESTAPGPGQLPPFATKASDMKQYPASSRPARSG